MRRRGPEARRRMVSSKRCGAWPDAAAFDPIETLLGIGNRDFFYVCAPREWSITRLQREMRRTAEAEIDWYQSIKRHGHPSQVSLFVPFGLLSPVLFSSGFWLEFSRSSANCLIAASMFGCNSKRRSKCTSLNTSSTAP